MLRYKNLSSGSTGNATLVEVSSGPSLQPRRTSRVLVDCGMRLSRLLELLAMADVLPSDIDAIFITHEHSDHIGCVTQLASRYSIPVWASSGTHAALQDMQLKLRAKQPTHSQLLPHISGFEALVRVASDTCPIEVGDLQLNPFTVPHDAREPLQLTCSDGNVKLGILTDLGHASRHVIDSIAGCNALLLESNHDEEMLSNSKYPAFLKARVGGDFGHLSNAQAAEVLSAVMHDKLRHVSAAHLSQQNNHPSLAQSALADVLGCLPADIFAACPETGTPWQRV
ncbi:MAG: MBL fold metallo-hydrolase [Burkholderiaceae bacterium]